jgi:Ohr subfamily peroxiredoxin
MTVDVKYRTTASAVGGRDGEAHTEDSSFAVKLSIPKELGGPGGTGTNPEQLFAAGYSACFIGALKAAGRQLKLQVPAETKVTATVGIGPRSEGDSASLPICVWNSLEPIGPKPKSSPRPLIRFSLMQTRREEISTLG